MPPIPFAGDKPKPPVAGAEPGRPIPIPGMPMCGVGNMDGWYDPGGPD
jgi:hypothetical protein